MNIIDTHAHLNDERLFNDIESVIKRAKENGVCAVVNNADSLASFDDILALSTRYPDYCYAVLGIHPEYAKESEDYFEKAYQKIRTYRDKIKAIGEIGLDYHYDKSEETKAIQKKRFIEQINLAKELNLPIVIHSRDADFDTLNIIKETLPPKIDLHCYSGSLDILKEYLKLNLEVHIGIGGVSTFKNAKTIQNIIKEVPLDILLTETDCPYLTPSPFRGERNEPSYLSYIVRQIASLKGENIDYVAEQLLKNGKKFYGIES